MKKYGHLTRNIIKLFTNVANENQYWQGNFIRKPEKQKFTKIRDIFNYFIKPTNRTTN